MAVAIGIIVVIPGIVMAVIRIVVAMAIGIIVVIPGIVMAVIRIVVAVAIGIVVAVAIGIVVTVIGIIVTVVVVTIIIRTIVVVTVIIVTIRVDFNFSGQQCVHVVSRLNRAPVQNIVDSRVLFTVIIEFNFRRSIHAGQQP